MDTAGSLLRNFLPREEEEAPADHGTVVNLGEDYSLAADVTLPDEAAYYVVKIGHVRTIRIHKLPGWLGGRDVKDRQELHALFETMTGRDVEKAYSAQVLHLIRQGAAADVQTVAKAAYELR